MKFLSFSKGIFVSLLVLFCLSLSNVSFATYGHHSYNSSIGDRVWVDENMNGLQDDGEHGAANVKILIGDCKLGKWIRWGKTDSNGKYNFGSLRASSYSIVVFPEYHNAHFSGAKISPYDKGAANKDSDAKYMGHSSIGVYGQTPCVWLGEGKHKRNIDFGFYVKEPNKLPDAVNDNYSYEVGDTVNQNIVTENDDIGDGCAAIDVVAGSLPDGITLEADGTLSGSPTTAGEYWIEYRLTDCNGDTDKALVDFVITKPNKLPDAVNDSYAFDVGEVVNQNIVTENDDIGDGCAAVEILSGALPEGVTLAADGTLSGAPTTAGEYWIDYRLTDCDGDTDDALVDFVITEKITYCAIEALKPHAASGHALWIPGVSKHLVFEPESVVMQTLPNGDLTVWGYVGEGDLRFEVDLTLSGFMDDSSDPKLELPASSYVQNGGSIDPSTWDFYANVSGYVKGLSGKWAGTIFDLTLRGPKAQIGDGANGKNEAFGLSSWFTATVSANSTQLPNGIWVGEEFHGDINVDLRAPGECQPQVTVEEYCAISAEAGPLSKYSGGHTLWVPAISKHLRFEPEGFVSQELPNGDLQVTGTVKDGALEFDIDWTFSDKSNTNDNPKLFLIDSAYVENGGSVDPTTWMFYATVTGTMTGVGGDWDGVVLTPSIRNYDAQIGVGANGKNTNLGFSSWINLLVSEAPNGLPDGIWLNETLHGDIDIDLIDPTLCEEPEVTIVEYCTVSAEPGQYSTSIYTHSVYLPAISPELRFEPFGFATQELPNGDLKITGTVKNGALEFDLDWTFSDKKNSHSTPKLSMIDAAYVANGGPIDPSTWMFYESLSGTLTGVGGEWDGVVLTSAIRMNPAQIGVGANGKTTNLGLSSWFSAAITAAPNGLPNGFALNDVLNGDTAIDLLDPSLCVVPELGSWSGNVSVEFQEEDGSIGLAPLANVSIELFSDENGDCTFNGNDGSIGVVETDDEGNYSFLDLPAGNYVAVETQPNGLVDVSKNEGGADGDRVCSMTVNSIGGIVDAGEEDSQNDFVEKSGVMDDSFMGSLREGVTGNVLDNDENLTDPVTVSLLFGTLPQGVTLASDGTVSGVTQETGTFEVTYQITDATGFIGQAKLVITIQ